MLPDVDTTDSLLNFDQFLRIKEAAALVGVHPDTLRRWDKGGKITTYRHPVNSYRLYRKDDLERVLEKVKPRA